MHEWPGRHGEIPYINGRLCKIGATVRRGPKIGAKLPDGGADSIVHFGSLAAFLPPGADVIEQWVKTRRAGCIISFDPNLRPAVLALPDARVRLERLVRIAQVIRVSDQDMRLAYPEVPPIEAARRWLSDTPVDAPVDAPRDEPVGEAKLVILTNGATERARSWCGCSGTAGRAGRSSCGSWAGSCAPRRRTRALVPERIHPPSVS